VIVLDTNTLAYYFINGPLTLQTRRALAADRAWRVPPRWRTEFRAVLVRRARLGLADLVEAERVYRRALTILEPSEEEPDFRLVMKLAVQFGIESYDAEFLALAWTHGTKVVTADTAFADRVPDVWITRILPR